MKIKISLIAFILLFASHLFSNNVSKGSRISLITCGQGPDLYSTFGHSAVRVIDSTSGLDLVYNYGTFEFTDGLGFYVKFTRGKLPYMLSVSSFDDFLESYIYEGRSVVEQVLQINQKDIAKINNLLIENAKPENREYKYDFFYDNCSTRIRDLFEKALGKNFAWHLEQTDGKTMRRQLNPYIKEMPWIKWGFYLTLGNVTDVKADYRDKMFLPFELEKSIDKAEIKDSNGVTKKIVAIKHTLLEQKFVATDDSLLDPVIFTMVIVLLVGCYVSHMQFYKDVYWKWYDLVLFTLVGLLGFLIIILWFLTDHQTTHWNFNLLWALPTHVAYLILMMNYRRFYAYSIFSGVLLVLSVVLSLMQPFHLATYILIFILAMRIYVNYRYAKHYNVRRLAFSKIF